MNKAVYALFKSILISKAKDVVKDKTRLNNVINESKAKAAESEDTMKSVKSDLSTLLDMLRSWSRGEYKVTPWRTLVLSTGALIYFINPLDAIPDVLPLAGLLDDVTVIGFVIAFIKKDIDSFKSWCSDINETTNLPQIS